MESRGIFQLHNLVDIFRPQFAAQRMDDNLFDCAILEHPYLGEEKRELGLQRLSTAHQYLQFQDILLYEN